MNERRCFVFPDGRDWIVFAPASRLVLRTNAAAARRFRLDSIATGDEVSCPAEERPFAPTNVTILCSHACPQRCVYCHPTTVLRNRAVLDPEFCRAVLRFMVAHAAPGTKLLRAFLHGVGEPTAAWQVFADCVKAVRLAELEKGLPIQIRLCTGGQVDEQEAVWIAANLDEVDISVDGPPEIQNRQRPRIDGGDALAGPKRLTRNLRERGKSFRLKSTVTDATVHRMVEIVEFVGAEFGRVRLDFQMMFPVPWVRHGSAVPPSGEAFVAEFGCAVDRGREIGVSVQHPVICQENLCLEEECGANNNLYLSPPNRVAAFCQAPVAASANAETGVYGWYDAAQQCLHFDHAKRRLLEHAKRACPTPCQDCPCRFACRGVTNVRKPSPADASTPGADCLVRIGVLKELLRRTVLGEPVTKETQS